VFHDLPFAKTADVGETVADVRSPASIPLGRLPYDCPLDILSAETFAVSDSETVAVVGTLASLTLEDDCSFCLWLDIPLATPALVSDFVTLSIAPLSAFACSDKFANAARKVMPDGVNESRAAGCEEAVVNMGAILTPILLHVACQHLAFAMIWPYGGGC